MSKWLEYETDASTGTVLVWKCDECGEEVETKYNFCPECGDPKTSKGKNIETLIKAMEDEHRKLREMQSATDKNVWTNDTISRQAAIDIAKDLIITINGYEQHNQAVNNYSARIMQLPPVAPKQPDCAKCKSELANKIRGQQDNPGMLTENDKGRNWGLEWAAQIVEGKRR